MGDIIATIWHKNFAIINFSNHWNEEFTDSNFIEAQFHTQYHGDI